MDNFFRSAALLCKNQQGIQRKGNLIYKSYCIKDVDDRLLRSLRSLLRFVSAPRDTSIGLDLDSSGQIGRAHV